MTGTRPRACAGVGILAEKMLLSANQRAEMNSAAGSAPAIGEACETDLYAASTGVWMDSLITTGSVYGAEG